MNLNRRSFLGACGAVLLSDLDAYGQVAELPRANPAERLRIGHIGVRNQGRPNLRVHIRNTVALCDVDRDVLGQARDEVNKANGGNVATYSDYRRLLDDKNVDAVVITTPDHWHALIAINACQAGKHVYCEKPLTLTIAEGRALVRAARRHRVVVQTGSQQRSDARFRQACELVRNGRLGRIETVRVGLPAVNFSGPAVADGDAPANLDYDFWLGPAPQRPYNAKRVHYLFRFFWDYSGGQLTNFGAHHLDIVQWALGMDNSGPLAIEGTARFHKQRWYEVPEWFELTYTYPNNIRVLCGQNNGTRGGVEFQGTRGKVFVDRRRIEADPPELLKQPLGDKDTRLSVSTNHHANWLEAIRHGRLPICDAEIGHRSATVCHLGAIALRTGRPVRWDAAKEVIVGDQQQAAMLRRPNRAPWRLPEV
jgi:myo-inositol 2-dehydrogenase / D-chiro-inositol 1-dehydrogenase